MKTIRQLKRELLCAIVAVFVATFALTSSTYAWYVANNSVMATTATVSAKTNGFVLQIANAEDAKFLIRCNCSKICCAGKDKGRISVQI